MTLLWHVAFNWVYLALFLGMYAATAMGITIGFHRLFTHGSFKTSRPVKVIFGILGSMAFQGPLLTWVAVHRKHHQCSDDDGDPHSPHAHGGGIIGTLRGFVHAHCGWMFAAHSRDLDRYAGDLRKDKALRFVSNTFVLWAALGLILPAIIAGLVTWSWTGAALGLLWGGLVRVFFGHHVTWSINSVCHLWGSRPFHCGDESRNNAIFGVLAFGEGWHNNHHAFPTSARHGLRWWQFDLSYLIIRAMGWVGLARDIRVPEPARIAVKLNAPAPGGVHRRDAENTERMMLEKPISVPATSAALP
jgi:stearoyl-CoA desaturase (delta-9 desaturase)